nr:uncharacterized protein LOC109164027 [Ipomoea trifida]GME07576.1 chaperone protein DnaJ C76, chloroplastic [Ipomoea batatas]
MQEVMVSTIHCCGPETKEEMEFAAPYGNNAVIRLSPQFPPTNSLYFPSTPCKLTPTLKNPFSSSFRLNCYGRGYGDEGPLSTSLAYDILGVTPNCSPDQIKAAFRARVKKFHPDVRKDGENSDLMIRRVIEAYEMLSSYTKSEIIESECLDPFDEPECEAFDLFVNQTVCIGKGCYSSCVKKAPHTFSISSLTGLAQATAQGKGEDYEVQVAVGQCPKSCIHYVTPSQRLILEELLNSIINKPYDTSAEAELLYTLIVKARFENNRYKKPKKEPKVSTKHVDWF